MDYKRLRLRRLYKNEKIFCVPLDHGITTGEIGNLYDFSNTVEKIISNGATSIIVHRGMVRFLPKDLKNIGLIIHLSGSTKYVHEVEKTLVTSVSTAIKVGADAVSFHINLGNQYERNMLKDLAQVSSECDKYQIPLLVMMYIRDNNNEDISTPERIKHGIRIVSELGADIVKISYKWEDTSMLNEIVKDSQIPVIVAGGELIRSDIDFINKTKRIMKSNIDGISYGRNIFLSHNIEETMEKLSKIVIG